MKTLTHDAYMALRRFDGLDGLRAIAALMVVAFHYGGPDRLQGWIGVQVFFVLSGYLITTLMLREEDRSGKVSLKAFYVRRVFRILPVYFVVLAITTVATLALGIYQSSHLSEAMPLYLTFFNEFAGGNPFGQSWSLGIEQKFYLLWPLVAFAFGVLPLGRRMAITGGLILVALVATPFTFGPQASGWPAHYVSILLGCAMALVMHNRRAYRLVQPLTNPKVAIAMTAGVVVLHYFLKPLGDVLNGVAGVPGFVWLMAFYPLAVTLLLPSIIAPGPVQKVLSLRPMAFIGERSYSLYLVQSLAAAVVLFAIPGINNWGWAQAGLTIGLSLLFAMVLYRLVEVPMINLGRKVLKPRVEAKVEEPKQVLTPVS
ncbi:peptidoglycan/LPS O-acetylase OafA/YrhL [Crossiella equi]|uniref:Peptidoglycan/LPS O-acetylase OafA/YrhL n=1 Tax=Crossiella equi TaxID=130796 RepID=A0ABS5AJM9_9PSEU|nr:acyltransferase [Crossiella equi]MBP2476776.1 peptidoglycan/LPS O-acetylase OafA/YrhL [Crossiella equi]